MYQRSFMHINGEVIDTTYCDVDGVPVKKTPETHPYSFDPFVEWRDSTHEEGDNHVVYSDRLRQWDYKKHNEACQEVWGNHGQHFSGRTPDEIERFLSIYFGYDVKLTQIIKSCNVSNGYPLWAFFFKILVVPSESGGFLSESGSRRVKDPLFQHCVIDGENTSVEAVKEKYDPDLISVKKDGRIEFMHVTSEDNFESIKSDGKLKFENNPKFALDLYDHYWNNGSYAILDNNSVALENLKDYLMDTKDNKILVVKGSYEGDYKECVYGEGHEGYVLLLGQDQRNFCNLTFEVMNVDDFLLM